MTLDLGPKETKKEYTKIHTISFEELRERALAGETFVSLEGYPVSTRDCKWDERHAMTLWMGDLNYMNKQKRPENRPLNKKGRPFSWSHSALNDFDGTFGCPLKYAHARYYCDSPFEESEAMTWGNNVHKSGEVFVRDGVIDNPDYFAPVEKYARLFRSLKEKGAEVTPELEIVLDRNMNQLTSKGAWFSKKAWFRVKIDVPVIQGTKASVFDYKTGKKVKEEHEQLHLCMAALGLVRPELQEFSGKLVWTKDQKITTCPDLDRKGIAGVWEKTLPRVQRMEDAWRAEVFQPRQNGLCRQYCPVTSCVYNGKH